MSEHEEVADERKSERQYSYAVTVVKPAERVWRALVDELSLLAGITALAFVPHGKLALDMNTSSLTAP